MGRLNWVSGTDRSVYCWPALNITDSMIFKTIKYNPYIQMSQVHGIKGQVRITCMSRSENVDAIIKLLEEESFQFHPRKKVK